MTPAQSNTRLALYVGAAMLTPAMAGLETAEFGTTKGVVGYILGILLAGVITWRSYIDKTPADVTPKTDQP